MPVRCWLSKASWALARLYSQKVSSPDWEATHQSAVQRLRSRTNIKEGDCPFIILISFGWKIENQQRGLALTITFLATAFR